MQSIRLVSLGTIEREFVEFEPFFGRVKKGGHWEFVRLKFCKNYIFDLYIQLKAGSNLEGIQIETMLQNNVSRLMLIDKEELPFELIE